MSTTSAGLNLNASAEEIWDVVTDFESWPDWDSGMSFMQQVDDTVRFRADIAPERVVRMKITIADEPHRLVLTGGLPLGLFRARRIITIEPQGKACRVTIAEEVGGLMRAFVRSPPTLEPSFELWCSGLLREVKRRGRR
ncbi:MAG: SRPBCC family protein [Actinomycetota bacterium]